MKNYAPKDIWNAQYAPSKIGSLPWRDQKFIEKEKAFLINKIDFSRQPMDILDYGGGTGEIAEFMREKGHNVLLTEIADDALVFANKHFPKLETMKTEHPSDIKRKFDLITCFGVLHHKPEDMQIEFMKVFANSLKPNGKIVICNLDETDKWFTDNKKPNSLCTGFEVYTTTYPEQNASKFGLKIIDKSSIRHFAPLYNYERLFKVCILEKQ